MAKKTVVITSCNNCKGVLSEDEPAYSYTITSGRHNFEIDLCEECNRSFEALFTVPTPPKKKVAKKAPARQPKKQKIVPCPLCDKQFFNAHGVQVHVSRSHKK